MSEEEMVEVTLPNSGMLTNCFLNGRPVVLDQETITGPLGSSLVLTNIVETDDGYVGTMTMKQIRFGPEASRLQRFRQWLRRLFSRPLKP